MIEVPLSFYFAIPVALHIALLCILWTFHWGTVLRRERRNTASRLFRCALCGHVYADRRDRPMERCARCGSFNDAIRR